MRRGWRIGAVMIIAAVVGVMLLMLWVGAESSGDDTVWVDFNTGELERRSSVLHVVVKRRVEATEFSKVARKVVGGAAGEVPRDWHAVDVKYWFSSQRDYLHYGWVWGELRGIAILWQLRGTPQGEREKEVRTALDLLRDGRRFYVQEQDGDVAFRVP